MKCEYIFGDGIKKSYKSMIATSKDKWMYADKVGSNEKNIGVNIIYLGDTNVMTNALMEDGMSVMTADTLRDNLISEIRVDSYYNGITEDEVHEDNTGAAYLIKFDSDENVKLLYQGPLVRERCIL